MRESNRILKCLLSWSLKPFNLFSSLTLLLKITVSFDFISHSAIHLIKFRIFYHKFDIGNLDPDILLDIIYHKIQKG